MICITRKEIIDILDNHPYYEILSEFKALRKPVIRKCKKCGDIKEINARNMVEKDSNGNYRKCPVCVAKERALLLRKTHEQFIEEMSIINPNIEIISEYTTSDCKVSCKCLTGNHIWETTPHALLEGHGCPKCRMSKGEVKISHILNELNIDYISQYTFKDCKDINVLRYDFYLPECNTCIEYDGIQHFKPTDFGSGDQEKIQEEFKQTIYRDGIKTQYCIDNNIELIRIPYTDFDNIETIINKHFS